MSELQFNLIDQPWILCETERGIQEVSLRGVLDRAHALRSICGESPQVTASIFRLLLATLHRTLGPADEEAWAALRERGAFDMDVLDTYFNRWRARFDLFDTERPFYQWDDPRVKPKSVNRLVQELASGNNGTLFDHTLDSRPCTLTPAQAARYLTAAQSFSLGGLSGIEEKFTSAPCVGGVLFQIERESLFESLLFNLCPYPNPRIPNCGLDLPAWEQEEPYDPKRTVPYGYLDYLTWQSRRLRLLPVAQNASVVVEMYTEAPGLRMDADVRDPFMHFRRDKVRGLLALRFSAARALWRDSAVLLSFNAHDILPPQSLEWAAELVAYGLIRPAERMKLRALGIASDQAKIEFHRSESLPLDAAYLERRELVDALGMQIAAAEKARNMLWAALNELAKRLLAPDYDQPENHQPDSKDVSALTDAWQAMAFYWSRLELPFLELLPRLPDDPVGAVAIWVETVQRFAWESLESVAGNFPPTPRHLKAAVKARSVLGAGLRKVFPAESIAHGSYERS